LYATSMSDKSRICDPNAVIYSMCFLFLIVLPLINWD
jgi:hypothetical protein